MLFANIWEELKNGIWVGVPCKLFNEPLNDPLNNPTNDPLNEPVLCEPLKAKNEDDK